MLPSTAATPPAGGDNFSRLTGTTCPASGTVLAQAYTSGIDALVSRVSTLAFNSPNGKK